MASGLPLENFMHCRIIGTETRAFVTNRADQGDEWVRQVEQPWQGMRIVGLSFFWEVCRLPDGSLGRRIHSIHICYLTNVLVYHLSSAVNGTISQRLLNFLGDDHNILVGEDIHGSMDALGFHSTRRHNLIVELSEVARFLCVSLDDIPLGQLRQHVALAAALLPHPADGVLIMADLPSLLPFTWPMRTIQIVLAAQTSFVAQKLGMLVYVRAFL